MYLFFGILLLMLILAFLAGYRRRAKAVRKIRSMPTDRKCALLNHLIQPFGYAYIPAQDIFTSRTDAWQREFGYCALYDRSAIHFHMVFGCLPVYFNYQGETWLIEFWKGQYGIYSGCEIGVYHAGRILDKQERESTLFQSVDDSHMPRLSLTLSKDRRILARLCARHWWLTAFCMGCFSSPADLTFRASVSFPDAKMADAFFRGLLAAGYAPGEIQMHCGTVAFCLRESAPPRGLQVRAAQWANRFGCRVFLSMTRPFCLSIDRVLYLYECLPSVVRRMLCIRTFRKHPGKRGRP